MKFIINNILSILIFQIKFFNFYTFNIFQYNKNIFKDYIFIFFLNNSYFFLKKKNFNHLNLV